MLLFDIPPETLLFENSLCGSVPVLYLKVYDFNIITNSCLMERTVCPGAFDAVC